MTETLKGSRPVPSLLWQAVRVLGWVLAFVLLVVTVVTATPLLKPTVCSAASWLDQKPTLCIEQQDQQKGVGSIQDQRKDSSVLDTMTALGTAVAVMTLVISLGVPWLYEKIKAVQDLEDRFKAQHTVLTEEIKERIIRQEDAFKSQQRQLQADNDRRFLEVNKNLEVQWHVLNMQTLWVDAQAEILRWLVGPYSQANKQTSSAFVQLIGLRLQALQSTNEMTRRDAFAFLTQLPWPKLANNGDAVFREHVQTYLNACHAYHAWRLWGMSEHDALQRGGGLGLWCLFWDKTEGTKFDETSPPVDSLV